ncbi:hypothetical protein D3C80_1969550 [compost metagenome]
MDSNKFELSLVALEDKWVKNAESNLVYVEKRLGALARTQDEYMNSTSVRLDTLEGKVKAFEIENKALKQQQKIYNNNLNINTVNK